MGTSADRFDAWVAAEQAAVESALEDKDPATRAERQALVKDKTWDVRTEEVSEWIVEAIGRR